MYLVRFGYNMVVTLCGIFKDGKVFLISYNFIIIKVLFIKMLSFLYTWLSHHH